MKNNDKFIWISLRTVYTLHVWDRVRNIIILLLIMIMIMYGSNGTRFWKTSLTSSSPKFRLRGNKTTEIKYDGHNDNNNISLCPTVVLKSCDNAHDAG